MKFFKLNLGSVFFWRSNCPSSSSVPDEAKDAIDDYVQIMRRMGTLPTDLGGHSGQSVARVIDQDARDPKTNGIVDAAHDAPGDPVIVSMMARIKPVVFEPYRPVSDIRALYTYNKLKSSNASELHLLEQCLERRNVRYIGQMAALRLDDLRDHQYHFTAGRREALGNLARKLGFKEFATGIENLQALTVHSEGIFVFPEDEEEALCRMEGVYGPRPRPAEVIDYAALAAVKLKSNFMTQYQSELPKGMNKKAVEKYLNAHSGLRAARAQAIEGASVLYNLKRSFVSASANEGGVKLYQQDAGFDIVFNHAADDVYPVNMLDRSRLKLHVMVRIMQSGALQSALQDLKKSHITQERLLHEPNA